MPLFEEYKQAVARLERTIKKMDKSYMNTATGIDQEFFLNRTQHLFDKLGNPERAFKIIHVTGTSGKGSTSTMLYNILRAAGKSTGLYMSPFVTTTIENIQTNGLLMDPADFVSGVNRMLPIVAQIEKETPELYPSYAEILFGIAMQYFAQQKCEWLVLEVGCGGRYDKTNIIPAPEVAVITNVSKDHTDILGDTIEQIAWHKAGIIKSGSKVFSAETNPDVKAVLDEEAKKQNVQITYTSPQELIETGMTGKHQQWNAALATAAAEALNIPMPSITKGIAQTRLPARIELMQTQPRVIIDGAHSGAKIAALVAALEQYKPWQKLHIIFAGKESKDLTDLLEPLSHIADSMYMTSFTLPGFGSHPPQEAAKIFHTIHSSIPIHIEEDNHNALQQCLKKADPNDLIVITGSLYLAGELRQHWISEDQILTTRSWCVQ